MKKIIGLMSGIALLTLASCTGTKKTIDLEQSSSKSIEMKVGQTYTVKLRENPSTGYMWKPKVPNDCAASIGKSEYQQDKADKQMVGVPGTRSFEVKADKKGECTIVFEQTPPGSSEVVKSNPLKVIVK